MNIIIAKIGSGYYRHSLNKIGVGDEPTNENPTLKIMLATHECSALHKDFVPLTFTFHTMSVSLDPEWAAAEVLSCDHLFGTKMKSI